VSLLGAEDLDRERLEERAEEEGLASALRALDELEHRAAGGETIESWELQEISKRLRRQP
jgi:hypothetical protein